MPPIAIDPHPTLDAGMFITEFSAPLSDRTSPSWLVSLLDSSSEAPFVRSEQIRATVRDLLRHGGYKPTGRGKPASEYLVRAATEGKLGPINLAVDACNATSLHSGLPISVVDLDRVLPPLRIGLAPENTSYVFNPSGQEIRVDGLLCIFDGAGPCANAVKDAQRTKTGPETRDTLSVIWGTSLLGDLTQRVTTWYRELLERAGATTRDV